MFQSLESKSMSDGPVFNNIRFQSSSKKDVWIMQQGHEGLQVEKTKWDRLALVIDKNEKPYQAKFYQLAPGELNFTNENEIIANKARCFACHASGPRVIRPNPDFALSLKERAQILLWNLKIKMYPKMTLAPGKIYSEGVPFKSRHAYFSQKLNLPSCVKCHSSEGIRGELTLEHAGTAAFLVKHGAMPPFPFQISEADLKELQRHVAQSGK